MPEPIYRDDVNKFSVYRLSDIPDGVLRSGWSAIENWKSGYALQCRNGNLQRLAEFTTGAQVLACVPRHDDYLCCAVLDEHAGPLLEKPAFRVGARVIPSAHGLRLYPRLRAGVIHQVMPDGFLVVYEAGERRDAQWSPRIWELAAAEEPVKLTFSRYSDNVSIPAADFHVACTDHLGARHGEASKGDPIRWSPSECAAWSAHLRFLVQQSEQRDRDRAPSVGWDPYGDDP